MPVPALFLLCALGTISSLEATDIKLDNKSFAVVMPINEKDRYFNITITTKEDNGYGIDEKDYFEDEQTPVDDPVEAEIVEK